MGTRDGIRELALSLVNREIDAARRETVERAMAFTVQCVGDDGHGCSLNGVFPTEAEAVALRDAIVQHMGEGWVVTIEPISPATDWTYITEGGR